MLPAILFRGLIPAGFMPAIDADGSLRLQFCPAADQAAADTDPMQGHHHDGATSGSGHAGHDRPLCQFAASATPAPLPTISLMTAVEPHDDLLAGINYVSRDTIPTIIRAQSPRAPPVPG
ncbi:MAG: DUF2946 family protein [Burkholderiales bacterium]